MINLILQRFVPLLTTIVLLLNNIGLGVVVPYNPVRTDVVVSGDVTTDIDDVLEYYNSAVKKTGFVIGKYSADVVGTPSASVRGGDSVDVDPYWYAYWEALEDQETYIFKVPGEGGILKSDVKSAKMSVKDGKISVIIKIKDTKRSGNGAEDAISRAYGWSYDYGDMFSSLGANMISGKITESHTDCTISCVIDENSGKIIYGDWDSTGRMVADDLTLSMFGIEITMDMDFTLTTHYDI